MTLKTTTLFRSKDYFAETRKVKDAMLCYHSYHDKLIVQREKNTIEKKDLFECLVNLNSILVAVYPLAKFNISLKIIQFGSVPDESSVREIAFYSCDMQYNADKTMLRIIDNTEFDSIFNDDREFFFVTDVNQYIKTAKYINSDSRYSKRLSTVIVFPIKKKTAHKNGQIIGFLHITSESRLNDTKRNSWLMKLLPEIAEDFGLILDETH